MVDYTKLRDDSWIRWHGGKKYTEALLQKYTAPHVWKRLAAMNPFGPATSSAAPTGCAGCARRRMKLKAALERYTLNRGGSPLMLRRQLRAVNAQIAAAKPAASKTEGV